MRSRFLLAGIKKPPGKLESFSGRVISLSLSVLTSTLNRQLEHLFNG